MTYDLENQRVPDSLKDLVCTRFGQNPLKDVDSSVFTRMLWKDGWTEGSLTISLHNFVGERIINCIYIGHLSLVFLFKVFYPHLIVETIRDL